MVTIAHLVGKIVRQKPYLEEALAQEVINYAAYAETLVSEIEKELQQKVKPTAVMMALRRLSERLQQKSISGPSIPLKDANITVKSDLFESTIPQSPQISRQIRKLYELVDFSRGDFLTITQGVHEITLLSNRKYKLRILRLLEEGRKIKTIDNLSSLTINVPPEAVETVGLFYMLTKEFAWENINIIEIVSTLTELTFILREEDIPRAYRAIQQFIKRQQKESQI